jgi:hypothetical protein
MSLSNVNGDRDETSAAQTDFIATMTKLKSIETVNASDVASIDAASISAALVDPSNESTLDKMHDVQVRTQELIHAVEIDSSAGRLVGEKIRIESGIKHAQQEAIEAIRKEAQA